MRVLCIYPGMDPRYNDNFHALRHLREAGVELQIVTRSGPGLKSTRAAPEFEVADGIPIHRHWKDVQELNALTGAGYDRMRDVVGAFKPDVVWCSFQGNLPLGTHLKEQLKVPLVLLVESLYVPEQLLGVRDRWWRRPRMALQARRYRERLATLADVIITSDPGDTRRLNGGTSIRFVPWCTQLPNGTPDGTPARKPTRATYIGSLYHFKNAQKLPGMIDALLSRTPTEEVIVVGPGPYAGAVQAVADKFTGRVHYVESLARDEALALLRESFIAFTPTRMGGWGFFGDCWSSETPVLALHNGYQLTDGEDAALASAHRGVSGAANRLYDDDAFYRKIQRGGQRRYREHHTAAAVGGQYLRILSSLDRELH